MGKAMVRAEQATTAMRRRRRIRRHDPRILGFLMVMPGGIVVVGFLFYPLLHSMAISLYDLNVRAPWIGPQFVGAANYIRALTSPEVRAAAGRSLYLAALGIGLGIPISLAFALILNRPFPLRGLVRGLLIVPWIIPGTVQGLLWARIYDPHYGALNGLLYQLGIVRDYVPWLLEPRRALLLVALANTCLLYTSPSPRDGLLSRMPSSA